MRYERGIVETKAHPAIRRLTEIRIGWGLTTEWLAGKLGCPATTINHMESGQLYPGLKLLSRWAEVLGYDLALKPRGQ